MQANSTFVITTGKEQPFVKPADGPVLTQGNFTMSYKGEMEAKSVLQEMKVYFHNNTACVYGLEHVTGHIAGKQGSFVLEHNGRFENGRLSSKRTVVKGSGTGDLQGLRGVIHFEAEHADSHPITLEYFFE
jgi:hypothetical protein